MLGESIGANIIRKKPLIQNFVNCRRKKVFYPSNNLGIVFVWTNFQSVVQSLSFSAAVVYTLYTSGRNVKPPTSIRKSGENCLFLLQETFFAPSRSKNLTPPLYLLCQKEWVTFQRRMYVQPRGLREGGGGRDIKLPFGPFPLFPSSKSPGFESFFSRTSLAASTTKDQIGTSFPPLKMELNLRGWKKTLLLSDCP